MVASIKSVKFLQLLFFFSVLSVLAINAKQKVSCKDEHGQDVDWFYIYKLPKYYNSSVANADTSDKTGLHYLYITSAQNDAWKLSSNKIDSANSMPAVTLQPIFDDDSTLLIAYNDEFPNNTVFLQGGHTKGVVATDGVTGLWLIHSVPKFPDIPKYAYPTTGAHYGQSFLCLTLKGSEMEKVGQQLIFNEPHIYYSRVPNKLSEKFPNLDAAIDGERRTQPPFNNLASLETLAGKTFMSFAKSSQYGKDLYEDWLAPYLDVDLYVEAWRNGEGNIPSDCSKGDKVYNIVAVQEQNLDISFKTSQDHSKWAVSRATGIKLWRWRLGGADWICVGDINRQAHQLQRGGGTVCLKSGHVVELYRKMVKDFERCEAKK